MKILRANCAKPNRQPLPKANSARQVGSNLYCFHSKIKSKTIYKIATEIVW